MLPMVKARYRAKATSWALGEASTGTPQVGIEFTVAEGDRKGEWIPAYFYLSDAAADRTLEYMRLCGWTGSDLSADLVGLDTNVVEIVCIPEDVIDLETKEPLHDERTGEVKQRLRVAFVNKAGGIAMKTTLTGDKAKLLAAKMKAKLAAIDAKAKRNGDAPPVVDGPLGPNPPAPTDDIPF